MNKTYSEVESISTWQHFRSITNESDYRLLEHLDDFPNAILVTGCQRSGTTMLSRIIRNSPEIVEHTFGRDDELDGALILSGLVEHEPRGRYCFQTTYVDQNYWEYYDHQGSYKMICVLRNPFSTIYSLVYNWPSWALNLTFQHGPAATLTGIDKFLYRILGIFSFSKIKRACLVYNWKLAQTADLYPVLGANNIIIVDYEDLVLNKASAFSKIFDFVNISFHHELLEGVHNRSMSNKDLLSDSDAAIISSLSVPIYLQVGNI